MQENNKFQQFQSNDVSQHGVGRAFLLQTMLPFRKSPIPLELLQKQKKSEQ
jgi:hypothetical protein